MLNDESIATLIKTLQPVTIRELMILLAWYNIEDRETFGFRDTPTIESQIKKAVHFLRHTERKWQDKVQSNGDYLPFPSFIYCEALGEGIELPINFIIEFEKAYKGDFHECK